MTFKGCLAIVCVVTLGIAAMVGSNQPTPAAMAPTAAPVATAPQPPPAAPESLSIPRKYSGPPDKRTAANNAVDLLSRTCPRLLQVISDFTHVEMQFIPAGEGTLTSNYLDRNGIRSFVFIALHLSPRPRLIPVSLLPRDDPRVNFSVSSGVQPGISVRDPAGLWLCDTPANQANGNAYLSVPEANQVLPY